MSSIFLLILALLPGVILLLFILSMDRGEKEPLGLVLSTMFLGALSLVPAAMIELVLQKLPIYSGGTISKAIIIAFVQIAWVEELAKLSVVLLFTWKNKNFNEANDGIVYVGASALGFAMLENIFYVLSLGMTIGILRAVTAMPLHCFTGVIMGYYVGKAKFAPNREITKRNILKGFFLAFVLHGIYDALILTQTPAALLIFPIVIGLTFFSIKFMKKSRVLAPSPPSVEPVLIESSPDSLIEELKRPPHPYPGNQLWKIVISRILLSISGLFWVLIIIGIFREESNPELFELILGSTVLTFLPILIGVILEISYHRKRKYLKNLNNSLPTQPVLTKNQTQSPPHQKWKVIISRTLLIIAGLFWVLLIYGINSDAERDNAKMASSLLGGILISFFPILFGVLLEISYRKGRKEKKPEYKV